MLDEIDAKLIELLQEDGRLSNAALAEEVGLTTSTVFERVKKLEKRGVIKGFVALVEPAAVGKPIVGFIRLVVSSVPATDYLGSRATLNDFCQAHPAILEAHSVAGDDCYVLKVRVANPQALEALIAELRASVPIARSTTSIVLSSIKESTKVAVA